MIENFLTSEKVAEKIVKAINDLNFKDGIRIMCVCGTHIHTFVRYGLESLLSENIEIIAGPGCPVCVTTDSEIDAMIRLALEQDVTITTFGDMFRVPGSKMSLAEAKAKGADVRLVYSIHEAVNIAKQSEKPVVHFAIGFETTMPSTAYEVLNNAKNFYIFSSHRFISPAMLALLDEEIKIDGFICPGHVSSIIGAKAYEEVAKYKPCVVAGFEPIDVLLAIYKILMQIRQRVSKIENEYSRVVRDQGNPEALKLMNKVFDRKDGAWRGFPIIRKSIAILKEKYAKYDAVREFSIELTYETKAKGCICDKIIKGLAKPKDCKLFAKACTPLTPKGPCMVSREGACYIYYNFGRDDTEV